LSYGRNRNEFTAAAYPSRRLDWSG